LVDLHRGRAGLVPSDAAASLAQRKRRRATQNDAPDAWSRPPFQEPPGSFGSSRRRVRWVRWVRSASRCCSGSLAPPTCRSRRVRSARRLRPDSRTHRIRSDVRAAGSGRSAGFVRLAPLLGSFAPPTCRSRWVRSVRRLRRDSRSRGVSSDIRAVGSGRGAGLVRLSPLLGFIHRSRRVRLVGSVRLDARAVRFHRSEGSSSSRPDVALVGVAPHRLGRRASTDALERTSADHVCASAGAMPRRPTAALAVRGNLADLRKKDQKQGTVFGLPPARADRPSFQTHVIRRRERRRDRVSGAKRRERGARRRRGSSLHLGSDVVRICR
jgi:hypothetical protein